MTTLTTINLDIIGKLSPLAGESFEQAARKTRTVFEQEWLTAATEIRLHPKHRQIVTLERVDDLPVVFTETVREDHVLVCAPDFC